MLNPLPLYYKKGNHRLKPEHLTDVFYVGLIIFWSFFIVILNHRTTRGNKSNSKPLFSGMDWDFVNIPRLLLFDFIRSVLACDCEPAHGKTYSFSRPVILSLWWELERIRQYFTLERIKHSRSITRSMLDITTEPSHRIIGAHHSVMLRLFWLGLTTPLNTSKTACKRLYAIHAPRDVRRTHTVRRSAYSFDHRKGLPQYTHDQRFLTTHAVVCFVQ